MKVVKGVTEAAARVDAAVGMSTVWLGPDIEHLVSC